MNVLKNSLLCFHQEEIHLQVAIYFPDAQNVFLHLGPADSETIYENPSLKIMFESFEYTQIGLAMGILNVSANCSA